jgi:hypothetical protein
VKKVPQQVPKYLFAVCRLLIPAVLLLAQALVVPSRWAASISRTVFLPKAVPPLGDLLLSR